LVVPPVEELDLVGPVQVFSAANRLSRRPAYTVDVVTTRPHLKVEGEGGVLSFQAHGHYTHVAGTIDSLLLVCGLQSRSVRDPGLFEWMRRRSPIVRRMGAVCVGAFLMAEAGLLDGRRATAHWKFGRELAQRYPRVRVEFDRIWVKDGNLYTSAGISAGMDLALEWVSEDCGTAVAQDVARELVLFLRRPAGQTQVSVSLAAQASEMKAIHELQVWIAENLRRPLSVQQLAARVSMGTRTFERAFKRELGRTPAQYVRQLRVEAARRQLETTDRSLDHIAIASGFASADVMRRAFTRTLGTSPGRYRQRVQTS
jgi:transcriptional regulator GlxA family with amidase domain